MSCTLVASGTRKKKLPRGRLGLSNWLQVGERDKRWKTLSRDTLEIGYLQRDLDLISKWWRSVSSPKSGVQTLDSSTTSVARGSSLLANHQYLHHKVPYCTSLSPESTVLARGPPAQKERHSHVGVGGAAKTSFAVAHRVRWTPFPIPHLPPISHSHLGRSWISPDPICLPIRTPENQGSLVLAPTVNGTNRPTPKTSRWSVSLVEA